MLHFILQLPCLLLTEQPHHDSRSPGHADSHWSQWWSGSCRRRGIPSPIAAPVPGALRRPRSCRWPEQVSPRSPFPVRARITRDDSPADLSKLENIRSFARRVNAQVASGELPPIRALVLNAAVQYSGSLRYTPDGYETTFAVNYLASFLLVLSLLQSMDRDAGRVVVLSSWTHNPHHKMNWGMGLFEEMYEKPSLVAKSPPDRKQDEGFKAGFARYGQSKFFLVMFM
jgi:NAD(P)-dependent dehydrogenase (short-subunit alcohol dehydrogenase family)